MKAFRHQHAEIDGARLHYVRVGRGQPLILLHGWPELWLTWRPVMERLAGRFDLIALDLRGFGGSADPGAVPSADVGVERHADDVLALADRLEIGRFGLVSHDVGAYVAQSLGLRCPERLDGLFFFNCPYPGIGPRWSEPDHLKEIWYQSFNQLPWAAQLVGASRDSCRLFLGHFLRHWSHRKDAFDAVLEEWVDAFLRPGVLQGGFNWYVSAHAARMAIMKGQAPSRPPIGMRSCVRWGAEDPVCKVAWADRLDAFFTDLDFAPFPGTGHFPHHEAPDQAAAEIARFFDPGRG
jgi:pimeloyl-ACP methyl ester carboxylesterase